MSLIDTAEQFFTHYINQDVDAMISLFTDDGAINYYPAELQGRASEAGRGIRGEGLFERKGQMHLDLKRCAQPFGDEVDGDFFEKFSDLHPLSRAGAKQPCHIVGSEVQPYENVRQVHFFNHPVTNFLDP